MTSSSFFHAWRENDSFSVRVHRVEAHPEDCHTLTIDGGTIDMLLSRNRLMELHRAIGEYLGATAPQEELAAENSKLRTALQRIAGFFCADPNESRGAGNYIPMPRPSAAAVRSIVENALKRNDPTPMPPEAPAPSISNEGDLC